MNFILASGSASRRAILEGANVPFEIDPANIDENAIKAGFGGDLGLLALHLAEAKARAVSQRRSGLVLGADQVLDLDGILFDKARSHAEASEKLKALRGRTHFLKGGLALAQNGTIIWRHQSTCRMSVRAFSDAFLAQYLDSAGDILTKGVGAYAYEGLGAQLFDEVEGDYYAVLGLPLLPLLTVLRQHGVIAA